MNGTAITNRLQNSFKIKDNNVYGSSYYWILGFRPSNRLPVSYYRERYNLELYLLITPYIRMLESDWLIAVIFFTNSGLALRICRIFTSCRYICIRFNFFSWYLQNRVCRFYPSPRRLQQNLLNVISCAFYARSFGRIKQIHHVRSWKRQTKGIIYLASVLNNSRCN
jgi:hypothetical protein